MADNHENFDDSQRGNDPWLRQFDAVVDPLKRGEFSAGRVERIERQEARASQNDNRSRGARMIATIGAKTMTAVRAIRPEMGPKERTVPVYAKLFAVTAAVASGVVGASFNHWYENRQDTKERKQATVEAARVILKNHVMLDEVGLCANELNDYVEKYKNAASNDPLRPDDAIPLREYQAAAQYADDHDVVCTPQGDGITTVPVNGRVIPMSDLQVLYPTYTYERP